MRRTTRHPRRRPPRPSLASAFLLAALFCLPLAEAGAAGRIAIIIDDMGYSFAHGRAALDVDPNLTFAFLPHAPHTPRLERLAHRRGQEIMLHLPMQSMNANDLDEGALVLDMTRRRFFQTLFDDLDAVPHAVGVNNHMGSLLTRHPGAMNWLMLGLKTYGDLFFVDSLTSDDSVAGKVALDSGVDSATRDVFLDHDRNPDSIARQFDQLVSLARRNGHAVGIGHPYPQTVTVLRQKLAKLHQSAVSLVKASELVAENSERQKLWRASSSPSPRVAKNSKRSP